MLAVTTGNISSEVGAGTYLVDLLGDRIPYIALPVALQLITMVIAFSTGTSWGTYAIAFPLAMPLAWNVAMASGIAHPELFMSVCFATVLNGSVYGDQCSPISDTTILGAITTGCDLTDHVKTQIVPASYAATLRCDVDSNRRSVRIKPAFTTRSVSSARRANCRFDFCRDEGITLNRTTLPRATVASVVSELTIPVVLRLRSAAMQAGFPKEYFRRTRERVTSRIYDSRRTPPALNTSATLDNWPTNFSVR